MSRGREIATVLFEKAWNNGDFEELDLVFAPGCVFHTSGDPMAYGVSEQIELINGHKGSFPDVRFEILHVVEEGDLVAMHVRMAGTQTGEYGGHPATGRSVEVGEMLFMRLEEDKIAEIWGIYDSYREHRQLGLI